MNLSSTENIYLIISFIFSLVLTCLLILVRINYKDSSISSIFFAVFFLTFYFYQPLLLIVDRLKAYTLYYSQEKPHFDIEDFLYNEYVIIGYIGTFFSNLILPIHKDVTISGYDTLCARFWDAIKRYIKDNVIYLIVLVIYISISFILYRARDNDEEIERKSLELVPFLLNCLILKDFFKAIWYLGAYFPLLIQELIVELNSAECCNDHLCSSNYASELRDNIEKYLEKDKKKLEEAYENIIFIICNYVVIRKDIEDKLKKIEAEQENWQINLIDKSEIEKLSKNINKHNYKEKLASAVRNLIETFSKIPRKIYEYDDIDSRIDKGIYNYCFHFSFFIICVGFFIFGFEISLSYYDYEKLSSPMNFGWNFVWAFFITFLYFFLIYFSVLKKNSLTTQNLYGIGQSDTLCLLKFAEIISGLIEPVSFLAVGTKALGIFALRENMTFMKTFDMPLVENIFIGLTFDEIYKSYISIRMFIFLCSFFMTFSINTLIIPCCCKKGKYLIYWKINDKNDENVCDEEGYCKCCF